MRNRRSRRVPIVALSLLAMIACSLVAVGPASATDPNPSGGPWCADNGDVTPCVISATIQTPGGSVEPLTDDDPTFDAYIYCYQTSGCESEGILQVAIVQRVGNALYNNLPNDSLGDTFSVTVDAGSYVPTTSDSEIGNAAVTRALAEGDYQVTVTGQTELGGGDCSSGESGQEECTESDPNDTVGWYTSFFDPYFFSHYANLTDQQIAALYGLDTWANAGYISDPTFIGAPPDATLSVDVAGSQYYGDSDSPDYGQPIVGAWGASIPNSFLSYFGGIDDPSTITPSSISVSASSGTTTVSPQDGSVDVTISDISFPATGISSGVEPASRQAHSKHKSSQVSIRVKRGIITPTKPAHLTAHRTGPKTGTLIVARAKPRGSRIVSYAAECTAKHHKSIAAHSASTRIHVRHLDEATAYRCRARAVAKAGAGHWSKSTNLKR